MSLYLILAFGIVFALEMGCQKKTTSPEEPSQPSNVFLQDPSPSTSGIFKDSLTTVRFTVPVVTNTGLDTTSLQLLRVDGNNIILDTLNGLTDNGDLNNGDDIQGDGVFSTIYNFYETTEGSITLRVSAISNGVAVYSSVFTIAVVQQTSDADFNTLVTTQVGGEQKYEEFLLSNPEDVAKQMTVSWLLIQQGVDTAALSEEGYNIWIDYSSGLSGDILFNPSGTRGGSRDSQEENRSPRGGLIIEGIQPKWFTLQDEDTVESRNVMVYDAFNWQFSPFDEGPFLSNLFSNSTCPKFDVTYLVNGQCDLNTARTFTQYGTLILVTHGGRHKGQVMFLSGEVVTLSNYMANLLDLVLGRVTITTIQGSQYFSILPSFISGLGGSFPKSIIYNGSCESSANATMANAFTGKGAKTYFAFTRVVNSDFAQSVSQTLFTNLVTNGQKTGDAFTPGQVDPGPPNATFTMSGSNMMKYASGLSNGGFEEGDLRGWSWEGDGRVITQLGPLTPQEGSYVSIISTGLGMTLASGSIRQSFCIPAGKTTLSFKYNFLSEEFLEFCGSIYQDFFDVTLSTPTGEVPLLHLTIDNLCGSVVPAPVSFDQGDVHMTGWITFTFNVSPYAGGEGVTLTLSTGDIGDSIYDTAVLIDGIKVE